MDHDAFRRLSEHEKLNEMHRLLAGLTTGETIIMGQLEDIRDEFAAALTGIGAKLDKEASDLAAALAAGQAPDPATIASLKALADHARDLAAPATPTAPAPIDPAIPVTVVDPTPAATT